MNLVFAMNWFGTVVFAHDATASTMVHSSFSPHSATEDGNYNYFKCRSTPCLPCDAPEKSIWRNLHSHNKSAGKGGATAAMSYDERRRRCESCDVKCERCRCDKGDDDARCERADASCAMRDERWQEMRDARYAVTRCEGAAAAALTRVTTGSAQRQGPMGPTG
jgi:hypothetical protein